jgi:hypothetical protein
VSHGTQTGECGPCGLYSRAGGYRPGPGRPCPQALSKWQMTLMTESIFVRAFSYYEQYLEELFILYTRGRKTKSGKLVKSYVSPTDGRHARDMLKANMQYLEWNSPSNVISRCEIYLRDGNPIKLALTSYTTRLQYMRKIRNAIAHRSSEASSAYNVVVRTELRAPPLAPLLPGEFLQHADPSAPPSYFLLTYFDVFKAVANIASG